MSKWGIKGINFHSHLFPSEIFSFEIILKIVGGIVRWGNGLIHSLRRLL